VFIGVVRIIASIFTIDLTLPEVRILSPVSTTYHFTDVTLKGPPAASAQAILIRKKSPSDEQISDFLKRNKAFQRDEGDACMSPRQNPGFYRHFEYKSIHGI